MIARIVFLLAAFSTLARAEIVLSDAPEQTAPEETSRSINVPKPGDEAAPEKPKAEVGGAVVQFDNGDKLHGELVSIEPEKGLRWASPQALEPIVFHLDSARSVEWQSRKGREVKGEGVAEIELTNGDLLTGKLVSLDRKELQLETWYAGKLAIPRARLRTITPIDAQGGPIYAGPDGLQGWKVSGGGRGNRGWEYKDGAFLGNGNGVIGRVFELPPTVAIDFEMAWRGQLQLAISFCSDRADTSSRDAYNMQINNNYVYVQRMSRDRGSNNLGQTEVPELLQSSPAKIGIRVNKEEISISLLVNGALVKQWTDRGKFAGGGGGVAFYTQGSSAVQIREIRIAKWDGKFPNKAGGDDEKSTEDTAVLENSDTVSGTLESIRNGEAELKSQYATLKIPVGRLQSVRLAGKNSETAKRETGDVRASFVNGGAVTLKLESWTAKGLRGTSGNFGAATFDPEAFEKIDFEPDAKEEEPELMGGGEEVEFVE